MLQLQSKFVQKPWAAVNSNISQIKGVTCTEIGESWEFGDDSLILPGLLADQLNASNLPLKEFVLTEIGQDFLGVSEIPILIKFLDTSEWLSLQVHPNDQDALKLENQSRGKTEGWFFLSDGEIISGISRKPQNKETYLDVSNKFSAKSGQTMLIPAGTVHALGPEMLVFEIQQNSDVTYRVYDKLGRELHLAKAQQVIKVQTSYPVSDNFLDCPYFHSSRKKISTETFQIYNNKFIALTILSGQLTVNNQLVQTGQTYVLQAKRAHRIFGSGEFIYTLAK